MFELWLIFGNPDVELERFPPHYTERGERQKKEVKRGEAANP